MLRKCVVLIFVEETVEKCSLLQTIEKEGVVCNFEYQKASQIQKRLKAIFDAYGVKIENKLMGIQEKIT